MEGVGRSLYPAVDSMMMIKIVSIKPELYDTNDKGLTSTKLRPHNPCQSESERKREVCLLPCPAPSSTRQHPQSSPPTSHLHANLDCSSHTSLRDKNDNNEKTINVHSNRHETYSLMGFLFLNGLNS